MNKTNLHELPWTESRSPKGKFHVFRRSLSLALGGKRDVGEWGGGHPFDVEEFRVPAGATNFPYHAHSAQWEFFLVTNGSGIVRSATDETAIQTGDAFIFPPGAPHQITNTGSEDLLFLIIADNPRADVIEYPDSGKLGVKPQRKFFKPEPRDYFAGEESRGGSGLLHEAGFQADSDSVHLAGNLMVAIDEPDRLRLRAAFEHFRAAKLQILDQDHTITVDKHITMSIFDDARSLGGFWFSRALPFMTACNALPFF